MRVLSLADRKPVAGADVYCLRPDYDISAMSAEDHREANDDFDALLRRVGLHRVSEADGWCEVPAVRNGQVYEVSSTIILQPGPAALTDGIRALQQIILRVGKSAGRRRVG